MARRESGENQQEMAFEPIGFIELNGITAEHERLWIELEISKAHTKELKAKYEESYAELRAAFKRVRKSAELEGVRIGGNALRNRAVNTDTGEVYGTGQA